MKNVLVIVSTVLLTIASAAADDAFTRASSKCRDEDHKEACQTGIAFIASYLQPLGTQEAVRVSHIMCVSTFDNRNLDVKIAKRAACHYGVGLYLASLNQSPL